jgi:proteasome lid subunit RPN8/RPN11
MVAPCSESKKKSWPRFLTTQQESCHMKHAVTWPKDNLVCKHYELNNMDQSEVHFSMDPKEQFAAVKDMRDQGLKLSGVYHSHPICATRA